MSEADDLQRNQFTDWDVQEEAKNSRARYRCSLANTVECPLWLQCRSAYMGNLEPVFLTKPINIPFAMESDYGHKKNWLYTFWSKCKSILSAKLTTNIQLGLIIFLLLWMLASFPVFTKPVLIRLFLLVNRRMMFGF